MWKGEPHVSQMRLIAGLGNPDRAYANSRHNLGFMVLDSLAETWSIKIEARKFRSLYGRGVALNTSMLLIKPQTFMNLSGESVAQWVRYLDLPLSDVLIVHDELDLDLGRMKLVRSGGSGGHKGVDSILRLLACKDVPRLKLGIGRPRFDEPVEQYVLDSFYEDEVPLRVDMMELAVRAVENIMLHGLEGAMNEVNQHNKARR
ncbi:MAG: aminoacyl-tRNA hydrolase [Deltaproteobacteria bacterium]|nr:aminoacyl-tRNA hydrolase [Deltaproteobacteria bacterium]